MGSVTSLRLNVIFVLSLMLQYSIAFNHLGFDDCSSPESEGRVFVHENSTWLECKSGILDRYCIAEDVDGRVDCVPHYKVKEKMDGYYSSIFTRFAVSAFYVEDSNQEFANCKKIQAEKLQSLRDALTKRDCLDGRQQGDTTKAPNIYCALKNNDVNYVEGSDWYTCKNGKFHLQRCVVKVDEEYKCVSAQKISEALEASGDKTAFDSNPGLFCDKFFEDPSVYPDYESELKACSEFKEEGFPVAQPPKPKATRKPVVISSEEETEAPPTTIPDSEESEEAVTTESSVESEEEITTESSVEPVESEEKTTASPDEYEYYYEYVDETEAPTTTTTTTARPRRRFRTRKPRIEVQGRVRHVPEPHRSYVVPQAVRVPIRAPAVAEITECKINYGWNTGQCFDPIEAAHRIMRKPMLETFNRLDKLMFWDWGQMTLRDLIQVADNGYQKINGQGLDGPAIVELVQQATGADKCTVIREKLPINDAIYWEIAKPCKCTGYRCNYRA